MVAEMLLIGGTSHAGKSTLAERMGACMGWRNISTDSLARHPGRPWRDAPEVVPPHVVEHYRDLDIGALMASVLNHYDAMWDKYIHPLMESETALVLEGSALLPRKVAPVLSDAVRAIWLLASDELIESRIKAESDYAVRDRAGRFLIDKFAQRAIAYNRYTRMEVERLGLRAIELDEGVEGDVLSLQLAEWLDD